MERGGVFGFSRSPPPRYRLARPITRSQLRADPYLFKEWSAVRGNFQRRVYAIPESVWGHLTKLIGQTNRGFNTVLRQLMGTRVSRDIVSEKALEDEVGDNLAILKPEYRLELFTSDAGISGRQYPCAGQGGAMGFIDLLCVDRHTGGFLVIELKIVRAGLAAMRRPCCCRRPPRWPS